MDYHVAPVTATGNGSQQAEEEEEEQVMHINLSTLDLGCALPASVKLHSLNGQSLIYTA